MSSPIRALVVDDDSASRLLICTLLDNLKVERVQPVESGRSALEALERDPTINLLVCDLRMPDVDGVALMSAVPRHRKLAVLIVSGLDESTLSIAFHAAKLRGLDILGAIEKPACLATLEPLITDLRMRYAQAGEQAIPGGREGFLAWLQDGESSCEPSPIMRLGDGQLGGLDVASSWGGEVQTSAGIVTVARQFGLQRELMLATLASAGRLHLSWDDCDPELWMSFALDAAVLEDRAFPDLARKCIASHWLEPEQIVFEVRQDDVARQPAATLEVIARLRVMGFQIALDTEMLSFRTALAAGEIPFQQLRLLPSKKLASGRVPGPSEEILHEFADAAHARSALAMALAVDSAEALDQVDAQCLDLAAGAAVAERLQWRKPAQAEAGTSRGSPLS